MELASRFRVLLADAGLSVGHAAQMLHVTPRTVRYWISGQAAVPYAAYKLVRVLRWFELPGAWSGWTLHSGLLWSPEGLSFRPEDTVWWSDLVRRARAYGTMAERAMRAELELQSSRFLVSSGAAIAAAGGAPLAGTTGRAERGLNLFKGHFGTRNKGNGALPAPAAIEPIARIPQREMEGVSRG